MALTKDVKIATRVDAALAQEFQKIVQAQDLTRAQVLRRCIREYVKNYQKEVQGKEEK